MASSEISQQINKEIIDENINNPLQVTNMKRVAEINSSSVSTEPNTQNGCTNNSVKRVRYSSDVVGSDTGYTSGSDGVPAAASDLTLPVTPCATSFDMWPTTPEPRRASETSCGKCNTYCVDYEVEALLQKKSAWCFV